MYNQGLLWETAKGRRRRRSANGWGEGTGKGPSEQNAWLPLPGNIPMYTARKGRKARRPGQLVPQGMPEYQWSKKLMIYRPQGYGILKRQ